MKKARPNVDNRQFCLVFLLFKRVFFLFLCAGLQWRKRETGPGLFVMCVGFQWRKRETGTELFVMCVGFQWRKRETRPGIVVSMCKFPVEEIGNWTRTFGFFV